MQSQSYQTFLNSAIQNALQVNDFSSFLKWARVAAGQNQGVSNKNPNLSLWNLAITQEKTLFDLLIDKNNELMQDLVKLKSIKAPYDKLSDLQYKKMEHTLRLATQDCTRLLHEAYQQLVQSKSTPNAMSLEKQYQPSWYHWFVARIIHFFERKKTLFISLTHQSME